MKVLFLLLLAHNNPINLWLNMIVKQHNGYRRGVLIMNEEVFGLTCKTQKQETFAQLKALGGLFLLLSLLFHSHHAFSTVINLSGSGTMRNPKSGFESYFSEGDQVLIDVAYNSDAVGHDPNNRERFFNEGASVQVNVTINDRTWTGTQQQSAGIRSAVVQNDLNNQDTLIFHLKDPMNANITGPKANDMFVCLYGDTDMLEDSNLPGYDGINFSSIRGFDGYFGVDYERNRWSGVLSAFPEKIDHLQEGKEIIADTLVSTVVTIASDDKVQTIARNKVLDVIANKYQNEIGKLINTHSDLLKAKAKLMQNVDFWDSKGVPARANLAKAQLNKVTKNIDDLVLHMDEYAKHGVKITAKIDGAMVKLGNVAKVLGHGMAVLDIAVDANEAIEAYQNGDSLRLQHKAESVFVKSATTIGFVLTGAAATTTAPVGIAIGVGTLLNEASEAAAEANEAWAKAKISELSLKLCESKIAQEMIDVTNDLLDDQISYSLPAVHERFYQSYQTKLYDFLSIITDEMAILDERRYIDPFGIPLDIPLDIPGDGEGPLLRNRGEVLIYNWLSEQKDIVVNLINVDRQTNNEYLDFENRFVRDGAATYYDALKTARANGTISAVSALNRITISEESKKLVQDYQVSAKAYSPTGLGYAEKTIIEELDAISLVTGSPIYLFQDMHIDQNADYFELDFIPIEWDLDDYFSIFIDDILVYTIGGNYFTGDWMNTGRIDLSLWAGLDVGLTYEYYSDNAGNRLNVSQPIITNKVTEPKVFGMIFVGFALLIIMLFLRQNSAFKAEMISKNN